MHNWKAIGKQEEDEELLVRHYGIRHEYEIRGPADGEYFVCRPGKAFPGFFTLDSAREWIKKLRKIGEACDQGHGGPQPAESGAA